MTLDKALMLAHETGDRAALIDLYAQAADSANSEDARGFYLTHAYVFALESGAVEAAELHQKLVKMGRDA